jgi:uncharacterized protein involved in outer membrane biogenesis
VRTAARPVTPGRALRLFAVWAGGTLAAVVLLTVLFLAELDAGYFRGPLIHYLAARAGRSLSVDGALKIHALSFHPSATAERVSIGNPPWMPAGPTAEIGTLSFVLVLPWFGRSLGFARLEMDSATLHLLRDADGHANWQRDDPATGSDNALPIIHNLSIPDAHIDLDDARRRLLFSGTVSAEGLESSAGPQPLSIRGRGQLNEHAVEFEIDGEPLSTLREDRPYGFSFAERSSATRLTGGGALHAPFDLNWLDTTFDATGADMRDLYFLTGATLVNTGAYHLSGKLERRGPISRFLALAVTTGESDLEGSLSIETTHNRARFDADLHSNVLRLVDLGLRAAGRAPDVPADQQLLLSDATLSPEAVRRGDWQVAYRAGRLDVGRFPLQALALKMTIDHGITVVTPLRAEVFGGKLSARVRVDATSDDPKADIDVRLNGMQLGGLLRKGAAEPPVEGALMTHVAVAGHGTSVHEVAATSNGTVTAVLPRGTIRAAFAELTGIDLRGLGLLLDKSQQEAAVRCGVASFRAHDGTLDSQSLVLDTDPVLITGGGSIAMDSEALDLTLRGHPKKVRLVRIRSPILVHGTLAHPKLGIKVRNSVGQAAEAVALGVILTPLASVLALVDPGLAKDTDCAALLDSAKNLETPAPATVAAH